MHIFASIHGIPNCIYGNLGCETATVKTVIYFQT